MLKRTLFLVFTFFLTFTSFAQKWEELNNQVLMALGKGDYPNALIVAKKANEVARAEFGENNADYSASLHNLASAHKKVGEYTPAEAMYWRALKIDKQVLGVKHQNYALSLFGLANLYKLKKDYPKAESIYLDALDIMERAVTDRHPDYSLILSDYADLQREIQEYKKAENNLRRSKDITRYSLGEKHEDYAGILFYFGKLYKSRGSIDQAERSLKDALALYENTVGKEHPDYKDCKRYLDNLYDPKFQLYLPAASEIELTSKTVMEKPSLNIPPAGKPMDTKTPDERVEIPVEVIPEETIADAPNVAIEKPAMEVKVEEKKTMIEQPSTEMVEAPVEVEEVIEAKPVVETPPPPPPPKTWNDYSMMMDKFTQAGDYSSAINSGEQGLKMVRSEFGEDHENYTWMSLKLADAYENAGLLDRAIPLYEKDLEQIEKTLGKNNMTYKKRRNELLNAYKETGQKGKAHGFYKKSLNQSFEKFNSASLLEQNRMMKDMQLEVEDYYANSLELGILIEGTEMQNFNLALKGRDTDAALGVESTMKGKVDDFQNQLRQKLKANEASIDFLRMRNRKTNVGNYYALVTRKSKNESVLVPLLDETKINTLLNAEPDSPESYIQSMDRSQQLYQLVWEPLEEHLKGINFIHVSTVGVLNKIAFNGLMDFQKNSLVDKYEIHYYSSLRDFINDKPESTKKESIAFFGGADFGGDKNSRLNYMPATKDEVNTFKVVCAAKGWEVMTKLGENASEGNFKSLSGDNAPGVLHLATPVYYQHLEEFSGIALADANKQLTASQFSDDANDGLLNAKEISKLDLSKTNLVLLSATETGADKNSAQGILSLQRALKSAGVGSILFSQWKVPDKQVQELLALFYINHLSGMDTHKAFYSAQKDIRKLYNSPYYWAGFILIE